MKKTHLITLILMALIMLSGCAHSPSVENCISPTEHIYGFWGGTWHGIITTFSFIGSLFDDTIKVYAVNNNGHWYDFGFVGGLFLMLKFIGAVLKALFGSK